MGVWTLAWSLLELVFGKTGDVLVMCQSMGPAGLKSRSKVWGDGFFEKQKSHMKDFGFATKMSGFCRGRPSGGLRVPQPLVARVNRNRSTRIKTVGVKN